MPNQQLLDYIDFKSKQGISNEEIKKLLLEAGWKVEDIDAGFVYLSNKNKNTTEFVRKSSNAGSGILVFIILFLLLAGGAFAAYKYYYLPSKNLVNSNVLYESNSTISATASSTCNNYDCLIKAASQCQPITAIIDFKASHPVFPYINISGKSKTIIKQGGSLTKCEFISSYDGELVLSISQIEKDKLLAQGTKQSDIDFQLEDINNGFKDVGPEENACQGNSEALFQYFNDLKDGKDNKAEYGVKSTLDTSTKNTTYTTSLGQKISCVSTSVNQNINQ